MGYLWVKGLLLAVALGCAALIAMFVALSVQYERARLILAVDDGATEWAVVADEHGHLVCLPVARR